MYKSSTTTIISHPTALSYPIACHMLFTHLLPLSLSFSLSSLSYDPRAAEQITHPPHTFTGPFYCGEVTYQAQSKEVLLVVNPNTTRKGGGVVDTSDCLKLHTIRPACNFSLEVNGWRTKVLKTCLYSIIGDFRWEMGEGVRPPLSETLRLN